MSHLIEKYNVPGPRYTSYPTVPYWDLESFSIEQWLESVKDSFQISNQSEGISIYIHLPFCENLCTFCGCHKRITKRHEQEAPYVDTLLAEWDLYCDLLEDRPLIKELHLGGGTPTFFSIEELQRLITGLFKRAERAKGYEYSFEGHPNNTTEEHLKCLYDLGFSRVSFGVQDYDPKVQLAIHRIQPYEAVKKVTELATAVGYYSVGHDLIYGLPLQTKNAILNTVEKTLKLRPDRIALYSYAHVPWIKGNGQRGFSEEDLPSADEKRMLYELAKNALLSAGYIEIGMDHFAVESDSLYRATLEGTLHRNFMGYTQSKTRLMIGLGMSSISDSWTSFAQNEKDLEAYTALVHKGIIPVVKGHHLNQEDLVIRKHILNLMTQFETSWDPNQGMFPELEDCLISLKTFEEDDLLIVQDQSIKVFEKGKPFIRNICMAFDVKLLRTAPDRQLFSMTI